MSDHKQGWKEINVSVDDLRILKRLYKDANTDRMESFMFHGHEIVTKFAKYWIEFIESRFAAQIQCPVCKKFYEPILKIPEGDNRNIQDIFPDSEPWEREQLISRICSEKCWEDGLGKEE